MGPLLLRPVQGGLPGSELNTLPDLDVCFWLFPLLLGYWSSMCLHVLAEAVRTCGVPGPPLDQKH